MNNSICAFMYSIIVLGACLDLAACTTINPDCQRQDGTPFIDKCVIHPKTTKQLREEAAYIKLRARAEIALATTCYPWSGDNGMDILGGDWIGVKS